MWDASTVEVWSSWSMELVLIIHGRFTLSGEEFYVFNENVGKQALWLSLTEHIQRLVGKYICLCGDFNVVRNSEERRLRGVGVRSLDNEPFNEFIDDNVLADLPLHGCDFT